MGVVKWQDLEKLTVNFGYIITGGLEVNQLNGLLISIMYPKEPYGGT